MSLGVGYTSSSLGAILGNFSAITERLSRQTTPRVLATREKLQELAEEWRQNVAQHAETSHSYAHLLRQKKKWQLFLISAVICGIELAYAAETAFVSPILLKIGIPTSSMSLIWCLSPLLGLVLVPIMGSLSDNCYSRFGRRRPFLLLLSLGIIFGLIMVPNARYIGKRSENSNVQYPSDNIATGQQNLSSAPNAIDNNHNILDVTTENSLLSNTKVTNLNSIITNLTRNHLVNESSEVIYLSKINRHGLTYKNGIHYKRLPVREIIKKNKVCRGIKLDGLNIVEIIEDAPQSPNSSKTRESQKSNRLKGAQNVKKVISTISVPKPETKGENEYYYVDYYVDVSDTPKPNQMHVNVIETSDTYTNPTTKSQDIITPSNLAKQVAFDNTISNNSKDNSLESDSGNETIANINNTLAINAIDNLEEGAFANTRAEKPSTTAVFFTCLGVVILDFCADASQSPARAYMVDVTLPEQHTLGLSTFTIFAGFGGSLGYALGAIDWKRKVVKKIVKSPHSSKLMKKQAARIIPLDHYRIVFGIILVLFCICLIVTLTSFKELPLDKEPTMYVKPGRPKFSIAAIKEIFVKPNRPSRPSIYSISNDNLSGTRKVSQKDVAAHFEQNNNANDSFRNNSSTPMENIPENDHLSPHSHELNSSPPFALTEEPEYYKHYINELRSDSIDTNLSIHGSTPIVRRFYRVDSRPSLPVNTLPPPPHTLDEIDNDYEYNDTQNNDTNQNHTRYSMIQGTEQIETSNVAKKRSGGKKKKIKAPVSLASYLRSIVHMPRFLRLLCITNLFSWMSLVCFSLYFTDYVGQHIFGGDPTVPEDDPRHEIYERGVRFGCWGMSLYSLTCAVYSHYIERFVSKYGAKRVYVMGQLAYSIGIFMMAISRSKWATIMFSPSPGIMYATLFTMPYILITQFHQQDCVETNNGKSQPPYSIDAENLDPKSSVTKRGDEINEQLRGLGTDIAIVSSMVFWAQFMLSSVIGTMMDKLNTTGIVPYLASVLSLCGAICASRINYPPGI